MDFSQQKLKCDLKEAINILLKKQNLDSISPEQYFQLECIVLGTNSLHQLPTGSGKTWAAIRELNLKY